MAEQQQPAVPEDPGSAPNPTDSADVDLNADAATAEAQVDAALDALAAGAADGSFDQSSIDDLLKQANFEDPSAVLGGAAPGGESTGDAEAAAPPPDTSDFELPSFNQVMHDAQVSSVDLLRDVDLNVKIELGRARMLVEDVLKLNEGSVVELDKLAGDPVDVFVNDRLVARGEVLVLNDNFCVRINEIVAGIREEGF